MSIVLVAASVVALSSVGVVATSSRDPLPRVVRAEPAAVVPSSAGRRAGRHGGAGWASNLPTAAAAKSAYAEACGERVAPTELVVALHAPTLAASDVDATLRELGALRTFLESTPLDVLTPEGPIPASDRPLALVTADLRATAVGIGAAEDDEGDDPGHVAHMAYLRALDDLSGELGDEPTLVWFRTTADDVEAVRRELARAAGVDARIVGGRVAAGGRLAANGHVVEHGTALLVFGGDRRASATEEDAARFEQALGTTRNRLGEVSVGVVNVGDAERIDVQAIDDAVANVPWIGIATGSSADGRHLGLLLPTATGREAGGSGPGWSEVWDDAWRSGAR